MRKLLLLSTLLLLPAHAQAAPNPPVKTSFGALPVTPGDDDAALALRAPAFAGLWVEGGGVALAVTSTDPAARRQVLAEVKKQRGASLNQTGHTLTAPRFVPVKYNAAQLSQARFLARGLRGWSEIYVDVKANKLHIAFQHAAYRQQAAEFFRQKGIPADALDLVAAASPTLPPRSTLSQPHRAALNVPAQVAQGDILPLSFKLTNTGRKPISLAQGCFTFKYRVLNATTGTEVRPVPAPGGCAQVGSPPLVVAPGQTGELVAQGRWPVFWDLLDTRGQVVAPGKYVLQAAYGEGKNAVRAPDVTFTVLPATPASTMRKALQVFSPARTVQSIDYDVKFAVQNGVPKLLLTVPDARARDAVQALAKREGVSLARLGIWVKPAPCGPAARRRIAGESLVVAPGRELWPALPAPERGGGRGSEKLHLRGGSPGRPQRGSGLCPPVAGQQPGQPLPCPSRRKARRELERPPQRRHPGPGGQIRSSRRSPDHGRGRSDPLAECHPTNTRLGGQKRLYSGILRPRVISACRNARAAARSASTRVFRSLLRTDRTRRCPQCVPARCRRS